MRLVVNAGSSSLKLALFDGDRARARTARVERIGAGGPADHEAALAAGVDALALDPARLTSAAHRVVHGGPRLTAPVLLDAAILDEIAALASVAPLHNPPALAGIRAMAALAPGLKQTASFDTAFHATIPALRTTPALPEAERARGLRRFGFHGLSYAGMVHHLTASGRLGPGARLLAFHLGNGASLAAILDGRSVDTTMGFSPLDGLTMGTRAGSLDPAIVLDLARRHGAEAAARLLNRDSGLLALGGAADMRSLRQAGTPAATFAIAHFVDHAVRHAGAMVASLGGLDAIAFTGGIGENDAGIRAAITERLRFLGAVLDPAANLAHAPDIADSTSRVAIWTVAADEEGQISREAESVLTEGGAR